MKTQRDTNKSTSLYLFYKKVNPGVDKYYSALYKSYEINGVGGCVTSCKVTDMKNILFTTSKIFFKLDGYLRNMKRSYGFNLPIAFEGLIGEIEVTVQVRILNKKKLPSLKIKDLEALNETLMNRLKLIATSSLRQCSTMKNII